MNTRRISIVTIALIIIAFILGMYMHTMIAEKEVVVRTDTLVIERFEMNKIKLIEPKYSSIHIPSKVNIIDSIKLYSITQDEVVIDYFSTKVYDTTIVDNNDLKIVANATVARNSLLQLNVDYSMASRVKVVTNTTEKVAKMKLYAGLNVNTFQHAYLSAGFIPRDSRWLFIGGYDPRFKSFQVTGLYQIK